jgi:AraC-like DNA-binding protein
MAEHVPSNVLEGVAELIASYGHDPLDIAKRVGIPLEAFDTSDTLISEVKVNDLFEEAAKVCSERFFGLKLAQTRGFDSLGPLWLLARNANTVGEALTLTMENMALHSQAMSGYIANEKQSGKSLVIEVSSLKIETPQDMPINTAITQMIELSLALTCKELRFSLGSQWRPVYAQFRHSAPAEIQPLRHVFGEHLFFNQDINAIHLSNEDFNQPHYRNRSSSISSKAKKAAQRDVESSIGQSMSFVQKITRIIRLLINDQGCRIDDVAQAVNLPVRTLQYRLKQHNTSHQKLYDSVRLDLAKHYLTNSELSIGAISERLHFTDTAVFSNFFKARLGASPRSYIKQSHQTET